MSQDWPQEIPEVVRRWMTTLGFSTYADFEDFQSFRLKDLANPSDLKDMDLAVDRLIKAFENKENICLYADFDMDGTPGLALLIRGLQYLGFQNLFSFQPDRFDHGYGVHADIVEDFIDSHKVTLFVTVDVGITDVEAVRVAKEKGVDFIITDHHQQKEVLPEAYAIVNPNQKDCSSGLTYLCGTGVAFYLVLALRRKMKEIGLLQRDFDPKLLLDCFAIGTLTDMVPLVKENRTLVQHGLLQLAKTQRKGLQKLMQELNLANKRLGSTDVSIQLAPKLNALTRMKWPVQPIDIFLVDNAREAEEKVAEVMAAHQMRVEIQRQGEEIVEAKLLEKDSWDHVFMWSERFHKGVVGLLANKTMQKLQVSSFMGAVLGDKVVGSGRAPDGMDLLPALDYASEFLVKFGGHRQAAGFELKLENAEAFSQKLAEFFSQQEKRVGPPPLVYDLHVSLPELNAEFMAWMKKLEPFGQGFPIPTLRLDHLFVGSAKVLKERHLKFLLKDMHGHSIDALLFFADNIDELKSLSSKRVSVLAQPSINEYMGREKLQLLLKDIRVEFA
ncbi:MAG: single-stranded-DNA-specific exonuclease RecJ [Bdellovibrionales bacterium]|nr:single-stranded-DNA-specific exonuclease RecJ [Bdellovibrionales bacterium]